MSNFLRSAGLDAALAGFDFVALIEACVARQAETPGQRISTCSAAPDGLACSSSSASAKKRMRGLFFIIDRHDDALHGELLFEGVVLLKR